MVRINSLFLYQKYFKKIFDKRSIIGDTKIWTRLFETIKPIKHKGNSMTNFTETRNLIQNNKKNDLKRKATMTRKQRLKKQLSIYFDILPQEGSHVEISCAAMKTAEILYPSMVQDLKSICLFEIIFEENDDFNIFNLYLRDHETFMLTIQDCAINKIDSEIAKSAFRIFKDIDFDIDRPEDHSTLVAECYDSNTIVSDHLTDIMLLINPGDPYAYHLKGIIYSECDFSKAEKYLKQASESKMNPNMAQISCRVLGDLYLNNNHPIKATLQYEKCLQYGPVSELVINGLEKARQIIDKIN